MKMLRTATLIFMGCVHLGMLSSCGTEANNPGDDTSPGKKDPGMPSNTQPDDPQKSNGGKPPNDKPPNSASTIVPECAAEIVTASEMPAEKQVIDLEFAPDTPGISFEIQAPNGVVVTGTKIDGALPGNTVVVVRKQTALVCKYTLSVASPVPPEVLHGTFKAVLRVK